MSKTSITKQTFLLFWNHARKYPKYLVPLLLLVPVNILIGDFLAPYITSQILQKVSRGAYDVHNLWASFGPNILVYAAAMILSGIIGWRIIIWMIWRLEMYVLRDLAQLIFNHLLRMSAHFHANRFGGSLVSQANKLTGSYIRFADATVFNMYTLVIALTAAIVILTPRVPLYSAALLTLSVIYIIGTLYFSRPVREANTREAEAQSRQTGILADAITNVMAVKSFAGSKHEGKRFWNVATKTLKATEQSLYTTTKRETYASMVTTSISISAMIIAVIGVGLLKADIGTVFLMVIYTGNIGMRLWDFQNVLRQYNRALGDASDMVKILQINPGIKDPKNPEPSHIKEGKIDFDKVVFGHADAAKKDILFEDLDLHIKSGEKVGLVGHSGSGKTTLTRILLRFSDINEGAISIDGQNIVNITQDDLRRSISYVPQEPLLFHRSIRENIAYGKPDATDEEVIEAARKAHAHEFIEKLADGYATLVGERGVKLSGGQRQRIAIARAILKYAPILVLDEATSALDSESERLIQQALQELMKSRTAIVIAHRLSTVQKMDRIVVMDHGKIVEEGTHAELITRQGIYASLWAHQSGGFIEE
jgi:ATP-binding cassette, subfamily B, bacterial